jgi:DNA-binding transcriptional ArsR family regulator
VDVQEAAQALRAAIEELGGKATVAGETILVISPGGGDDVVLAPYPVGKLATGAGAHVPDQEPGRVPVLVADLITAPSREALAAAGLSWFDRRGHVRLWTEDLWIDADVTPIPRVTSTRRRRAISGPAQVSVAAAHLLGLRPGVRELARRIGLSAGAVSKARRSLTEQGLLTADGEPAVPDLFWALADAWAVTWSELPKVPPADDGLVLVGSGAAARLGAPMVVTEDWPPELLGRDPATVERARLRAGTVHDGGACRIGLAPTPLVADPELVSWHDETRFPIAHPLFVALELAHDPARGSEALEQWDPGGFTRVW